MSVRLALLALTLLVGGCAATAARSSAGLDAAGPASVSQQSGQGNLATQIAYTTAVPLGQVVLMFAMLVLSHWRELVRLYSDRLARKWTADKPRAFS